MCTFECQICYDCQAYKLIHAVHVRTKITYVTLTSKLNLYLLLGTPDVLSTAPNERKLVELLADIDDQWFVIGQALSVPLNVLNGLQTTPLYNTVRLIQVIHTWFTSQPSPVIWETVISAIEGPIVNNKQKAKEIRDYLYTQH